MEIKFKDRIKLFFSILRKDLKSEIRQINDIFSIFLFDVISIFIFSSVYSFSTQYQQIPLEIFIIEVWLIIFFTLIFIMAKLFIKEKESGTLGGLIYSPISANTIIFSKVIFCFILLSFIEIILFLFSFFISNPLIPNLQFNNVINYILLGIILPTLDLSICGTIVSAISMYAKKKSFIIPLILFPIILPITIPIISINIKLLELATFLELTYEILFLVSHIILMTSILALVSQNLLFD
ncbi:MAG: heme exporter protein CcmB [Candidatus Heimdallarchaeota archaeon]